MPKPLCSLVLFRMSFWRVTFTLKNVKKQKVAKKGGILQMYSDISNPLTCALVIQPGHDTLENHYVYSHRMSLVQNKSIILFIYLWRSGWNFFRFVTCSTVCIFNIILEWTPTEFCALFRSQKCSRWSNLCCRSGSCISSLLKRSAERSRWWVLCVCARVFNWY